MSYQDRKFMPKGNRPSHVTVIPKRNEHPDKLIKRFMRKFKKAGVLDELRERRFYEKPSTKRRKKRKQRERVLRKLAENSDQ
jgi:small subunit ribosomal protein S21